MNKNMFCFQCEQTSGCSGCTGNIGVCGKTADVAGLQDELVGALIHLAKAAEHHMPSDSTHKVMIEGLFTTLTNFSFNEETLRSQITAVKQEQQALLFPQETYTSACDCNIDNSYDLSKLWTDDEDIRSLKSLILFGLKGIAAYAYHALVLGHSNEKVNNFFYEGLRAVGNNLNTVQLLPVVMKVGEINLICMELLDRANTKAFGHPTPTNVSLRVEKGPFIVISGHDLRDLKLLLEQTGSSLRRWYLSPAWCISERTRILLL